MVDEEKKYRYWLHCIPGVGNRTIEKLFTICNSAQEIYESSDELWNMVGKKSLVEQIKIQKIKWDLDGEYEKLEEKGIRFLYLGEIGYPQRLCEIPDSPFGLFVRGSIPCEENLTVAVIGAREPSEYGEMVACELGRYLGQQGIQVISGMARGIDGISQRATIGSGGRSFAVLGSGVDVCYPVQNKKLYEDLCETGGVISIYPPGTRARPQNFPPRNRIVSGLADVVVVVEARMKSGTLITVDMALEQGKEVYVVPGRITDRLSDGCNTLIRQGAEVFLSPKEFVKDLCEIKRFKDKRIACVELKKKMGMDEGSQLNEEHKSPIELGEEFCELYRVLDLNPRSIEEIIYRLEKKVKPTELNLMLMKLCMEGYALQCTPGYFALRK